MIKKIFFVVILVLALVFVINTVFASSRQAVSPVSSLNNKQTKSDQDDLTVVKIIKSDNLASSSVIKKITPAKSSSQDKEVAKAKISVKTVSSVRHTSIKKTNTSRKKINTKHNNKSRAVSARHRYPYGTTMRWDSASLRYLSRMAYFDYSYYIRSKTIRKIETYARGHHVSEVTMSMMNHMVQ